MALDYRDTPENRPIVGCVRHDLQCEANLARTASALAKN
jgi:hypothetical protein